MIEAYFSSKISSVIQRELEIENCIIDLEIPSNPDHGDFSTTIAFKLAKQLKKSPMLIASELASVLNEDFKTDCVSVNAISGFVNLKLSDAALIQGLNRPFSGYGINPLSINLEYVSANPTGPLHIGHGRWAVMGNAIARLLKEIGHKVTCEFYINDAGTQIENFIKSIDALRNGKEIPENGYHGAYIQSLADSNSDSDPVLLMTSEHNKVLKRLGVEFDIWFSEKSLHRDQKVIQIIEKIKKYNLSYELDGALWFKTSHFGDDKDRVLIKADGNLTYFAVDIAYHFEKISRGYDILIDIWGADHHGYVARMSAALQGIFGPDFQVGKRFQVLIGQLVTLYRNGELVRMSKRTGEMITLEEVIDEIGIDATRFFLMQKSHDSAIDFDLSVASEKSSENPVYYVQYAHARISTLLKKSSVSVPGSLMISASPFEPSERELLMMLLRYRRAVLTSATQYLPHILIGYLIQLAKSFHVFYHHCPVLNSAPDIMTHRLAILSYTQATLKSGLSVLGISAPDSM